jgi:hypothetical protein
MVQLSRRPPVNSPWHPGACGGCNAVVQTGGTLSALEADEDGWTTRIQQLFQFFFPASFSYPLFSLSIFSLYPAVLFVSKSRWHCESRAEQMEGGP